MLLKIAPNPKRTPTIAVGDRVTLRKNNPLGQISGKVIAKHKQGGRNIVEFDNGVKLRPLFDAELLLG